VNNICIIPARGGSQRIPRKNIKEFCGKPIIAYSIEAALASRAFDEVMVSTDDKEIAALSKQLGARVPFMRSPESSGPDVPMVEVVREVLSEYSVREREFDYACMVYATAPMILAEDLSKSARQIYGAYAAMIAVAQDANPIERTMHIHAGRLMRSYPLDHDQSSIKFAPTYHHAEHFWWIAVNKFKISLDLWPDNTTAYIIPESRVAKIDTLEDWALAEAKYKLREVLG
jgi:pseudaminic acid cytidylyltransferase